MHPKMKANIDAFRAATAGVKRRFQASAKDDVGELYMYDVIADDAGWGSAVTPKDVVAALADLKTKGVKTLNIFINSPGGDVFAAVAIFNALQRFDGEKVVHVDGLAASSASLIAMAGDKVVMGQSAMMMIHNPWGFAMGEAEDFRKTADMLDQVRDLIANTYVNKTGCTMEDARAWMDAETWMDASEAVKRGFADASEEEPDEDDTEEEDAKAANNLRAASKTRVKSAQDALKEMAQRIKNTRVGQPLGTRTGQPARKQ